MAKMTLQELLLDNYFKSIMEDNIVNVLTYLINNDIEFSVVANIKAVEFNPQLPKVISQNFPEFPLFNLVNYTFSTLDIEDEGISFEAGFGRENFGSVCFIPYNAIFQIVKDDSILLLNPLATIDEWFDANLIENSDTTNNDEDRLDIFLNNPKNKDIFK